MKIKEFNEPTSSQPDTQSTGMAQNQLLKIGQHAIKIENMIGDSAEMNPWVAKKIDLVSNYVKSVHGNTSSSEYDDNGMSEDGMTSADVDRIHKQKYSDKEVRMAKGVAFDKRYKGGNYTGASNTIEKLKKGLSQHPDVADALKRANEDAGTSPLKETAKMAIELIELLNNGGSIDEATQNILNQAADNLQAVYHYEDYQKQNPYSEEIDSALVQKHSQLVQAGLEGILAHNTKVEDVDTKPGMMRILKKRVNEIEKDIAKENRTDEAPIEQDKDNPVAKPYVDMPEWKALHDMDDKIIDAYIKHKEVKEGGMPSSIIKHKQKLAHMSDEELADRFKGYDEKKLRQMAWSHGYGNMSSHYLDRVRNVITSKRTATPEAELEEGLKDWAKNLAMAGVIVGSLAGVGSINDAMNNSVPAVKAMNTAYEMAVDAGNTELANNIKKDISDAKVRLDSGKDLNHIKHLQDKYSKFMSTEGLAYESKLAVQLNKQLK
jgi:hypothetical protein